MTDEKLVRMWGLFMPSFKKPGAFYRTQKAALAAATPHQTVRPVMIPESIANAWAPPADLPPPSPREDV